MSQIKPGDTGERIFETTHAYLEHYWNVSFLGTSIKGHYYEVAYRYAPDGKGPILDISYLPVTPEQYLRAYGP